MLKASQTKEKKPRAPRKIKLKFKLETLPDVIDGDLFLGKVGMYLIIVRSSGGKQNQHKCEIREISEKGLVSTWDETAEQWYSFNISDVIKSSLVVKMLS